MKISLYFYSIPQYLRCLPVINEADYIYLPHEYFTQGNSKSKSTLVYIAGPDDTITYNAEEHAKEKYIMTFPYILKGQTKKQLLSALYDNRQYPSRFLAENLGDINAIRDNFENPVIHGDYSLNIQNKDTMDTLFSLGFKSLTLSPELDLSQITGLTDYTESGFLKNEKYSEIVCYGRIILMRSEHCYIADEKGYKCGKCTKGDEYSLKDKEGAIYPVICNPADCRSVMLDRLPLMIRDKAFLDRMRHSRSCILRLNIFNEEVSVVSDLIKYFKYGLENDDISHIEYYTGHYK